MQDTDKNGDGAKRQPAGGETSPNRKSGVAAGETATNVLTIETRVERLWREFTEVKRKAMAPEATVDDGIVAGRAWSAFLAEFVGTDPDKQAVHGKARGQ